MYTLAKLGIATKLVICHENLLPQLLLAVEEMKQYAMAHSLHLPNNKKFAQIMVIFACHGELSPVYELKVKPGISLSYNLFYFADADPHRVVHKLFILDKCIGCVGTTSGPQERRTDSVSQNPRRFQEFKPSVPS